MTNSVAIDDVLFVMNREIAHATKNRVHAKHNSHVLGDQPTGKEYLKGFYDGKEEAYRIIINRLVQSLHELELVDNSTC